MHMVNAAQLAVLVVVMTRAKWRVKTLSFVAVLFGDTIGRALSFSFPLDTYLEYDSTAVVVATWLGALAVLTIRRNGATLEVVLAGIACLAINSGILMRGVYDLYERFGFPYVSWQYLPFGSLSQLIVNVDWDFSLGVTAGFAAFLANAAFVHNRADAEGMTTDRGV
jgi:hypothetical protein